jgi:hypothetical protein
VNGAWLANRSAEVAPSSRTAQSTKARALPWLTHTPLGMPVDPEVYRM